MSTKIRFILAALAWGLFAALPNALAQTVTPSISQQPRNLVQEEQNRSLVIEFYTKVLSERRVDLAPNYMREDYIQHNPLAPNGREAFMNFFREMFKSFPQSEHRIIRTAVDGDLVYLHVFARNNPEDRGRAVMDILRVQDGKIAEHWDVVQPVPEGSANPNSMF
ncbi:nuclear transport factor 2 family protein [Agrobacterium sp. MCAB5]|uniref:nuclear transport factor 2 family protein n=1 Tax=Agrobacterium sp. MCAB5 TaxID=3233042 RepID=UPI003F8FF19F